MSEMLEAIVLGEWGRASPLSRSEELHEQRYHMQACAKHKEPGMSLCPENRSQDAEGCNPGPRPPLVPLHTPPATPQSLLLQPRLPSTVPLHARFSANTDAETSGS